MAACFATITAGSRAAYPSAHSTVSKRALLRGYTRHRENTDLDVSRLTWSPNGKRAYYTISESPTENSDDWVTLFSIHRDGAHITRLLSRVEHGPNAPDLDSVKWAPDSRHILMVLLIEGGAASVNSDGVDLIDIDSETGVQRKLSCDLPDKKRSGQVLWHRHSYRFSPDRKTLLISLGGDRFVVHNKRVVCVDYATGRRKPLTAKTCSSFSACWSPDGRRIAYVSGPDATIAQMEKTNYVDLLSHIHLCVMNSDGTRKRCIVAGKGYYEDEPVWSGDGKTITFVRYKIARDGSDKKEQWSVHLDGTGLKFVRAMKNTDGDD